MALSNIAKFNWDKVLSKADHPDVKRSLNMLRAKANEIVAANQKYSGDTEKIDFSAYKKKLRFTAGAVDLLEAAYEKRTLPSYHASLPAFDSKKRELMLTVADQIVAAAKLDLENLKEELKSLETNKISKDTTTEELMYRFPNIARKIEDDLKHHRWAGQK